MVLLILIMKHYLQYVFLSVIPILMSCTEQNKYPAELIEADKMYMSGKYDVADSLIAVFDESTEYKSYHTGMYRQLLELIRLYTIQNLSSKEFPIADNLMHYYERRGSREYIMARLVFAEISRTGGDYPLALSTLLNIEQETSSCDSPTLQIWTERMKGDIYFEQRMLDNCSKYYRESYALAYNNHDTLRMAHGAYSMARVCIINNDVDSTIHYLNNAIKWSKSHPEGKRTSQPARSVLADIYIQTEQYDKASELLTRDSIDDENWAYWHLGQQHTDSAVYYFNKMLGNYSWLADVTFLQTLAEIEEQRGNRDKALEYYKKLNAAKDSLKEHSQIEETRQTEARHKFDIIKQERDEADRQKRNLTYLIVGIGIFVVVVALATIMAWRAYRTKEADKLLRKKLLQHTEERKTQLSTEQKAANEHQIDLLERSPLRERIKENAGKDGFRLTDGEWHELAAQIDLAYDQFTARLRILYDGITEYELHVCYLIKLGITSTDIGNMLCKSKSAVGMTRQRLYKKLTGSKGTARDLNELIRQF